MKRNKKYLLAIFLFLIIIGLTLLFVEWQTKLALAQGALGYFLFYWPIKLLTSMGTNDKLEAGTPIFGISMRYIGPIFIGIGVLLVAINILFFQTSQMQ